MCKHQISSHSVLRLILLTKITQELVFHWQDFTKYTVHTVKRDMTFQTEKQALERED